LTRRSGEPTLAGPPELTMADAIAVFHPADPSKLVPFLDLDDENEESEGLYAEALEDGTYLVHTFQPFEAFTGSPDEARSWLEQFGDALPFVHDDPRGLLFYPDTREPEATTYDAVVAELAGEGVFVPLVEPGIDLAALAAQLQGGSAFEVGQLIQDMQKKILEQLVVEADEDEDEPGDG